jgi:hypothetical protein
MSVLFHHGLDCVVPIFGSRALSALVDDDGQEPPFLGHQLISNITRPATPDRTTSSASLT